MYYVFPKNYIYHHGIKGQKWGIRRFQDKSGRLTAAGRQRINRREKENEKTEDKKRLTDKQKKYIAIGAAAVGTALVAYGGYKLYKHKSSLSDEIAGLIDSKTGLLKYKQQESIESTLKKVNPKFSFLNPKYYMNCGNCGIAFEARMRGFDVEALGNPTGMTKNSLGQFFKGFKSETFKDIDIDTNSLSLDLLTRGKQVEKSMMRGISEQCGNDDGRGMLFFPADFGSHWVSWIKNGNDVKFYNSQNTSVDLTKDVFSHYYYHRNNIDAALTSVRLDDLEINGDTIKNVVVNRRKLNKNVSNFDTFAVIGENFVTRYM